MGKSTETVVYNPNETPAYTIRDIKRILPHAHPFLLVDKILRVNEEVIEGVKNITFDQACFQGHFPDEPVFPGVLILEALAQCGGILVLHNEEHPEEMITYFLKIDNAKFKQKVVPGDTLLFRMKLTNPVRRGICEMHAEAFVGDKLVAEADMVAQITKKQG